MNSRMSDANTLEHHLPVHSGGKVKSEWWFLFLGSHGQTMVQTARKWGIFCPSMNCLPLWCSVLCLWHIPASCWKQAVPESRAATAWKGGSAAGCAARSTGSTPWPLAHQTSPAAQAIGLPRVLPPLGSCTQHKPLSQEKTGILQLDS